MKRKLLFGFSLVITFGLAAQSHYEFSKRTENYVEISSGNTVIESGDWSSDVNFGMPMPFSFNYFGENVDSIFIYHDGFGFTDGAGSQGSPHGILGHVQARGDGFSPISYRVVGDAPNRILQIQWQNFTFSKTIDLQLNEFANYQVWFYEGSRVIEFHIGSSYVSEASLDSFSLNPGLVSSDGTRHIFLEGDPSNPTSNFEDIWDNTNGLSDGPPVNTMYVFTPAWPSSYTKANELKLDIFPVPMSNTLFVQSESTLKNIRVLNSAGAEVFQTSLDEMSFSLETSYWPNGVYFLQINTANGLVNRKVVK